MALAAGIKRRRVGHRLNDHGIIPSYHNVPYPYRPGLSSSVIILHVVMLFISESGIAGSGTVPVSE